MTRTSSFARKVADTVRQELEATRLAVRDGIVAGAGFPVVAGTIRVRMRELRASVRTHVDGLVPLDGRSLVPILAGEPDILENMESSDSKETMVDILRQGLIDQACRELEPDIRESFLAQFPTRSLESVIHEIREVSRVSMDVNRGLSNLLDQACTRLENSSVTRVPRTGSLLSLMDEVRQELAMAGRMGDTSKLVAARQLMELTDLIDVSDGDLKRSRAAGHDVSAPGP